MNQTLAIARRELAALFFSPIAYVVLGLFSLGTAMIFLASFAPGEPAILRDTFYRVVWLMIFLVPAITMRLITDEFRAGTIELLMTSPIHDGQVIAGKWLGALGFFAALLSPLVVFAVVLTCTSRPDYGPILTGFIGLLLTGALFLAIGTFASAVTQNQIIAFILTVALLASLTIFTSYLAGASFVTDNVRQMLNYGNPAVQYENFSKGVIDWPNVVYYASGITFFLFIATQVLQSRRWR